MTHLLNDLWPLDVPMLPDVMAAMSMREDFSAVAHVTHAQDCTMDNLSKVHSPLNMECQHLLNVMQTLHVRPPIKVYLRLYRMFYYYFHTVLITVVICWMAGFHLTILFVPIESNRCKLIIFHSWNVRKRENGKLIFDWKLYGNKIG